MNHQQSVPHPAGIGALEIKRAYQRNLFLAVMLASGTAFMLTVGLSWHTSKQPAPDVPSFTLVRIPYIASPMPTMVPRPKIETASGPTIKPAIGIPIPVEDDSVVNEVHFATTNQMAQYIDARYREYDFGDGNKNVVYLPPAEDSAVTEIFEFAQVMPVPVHTATPAYPEMAERAGLKGTVLVKALVDQFGCVLKAEVAKASGINAGFEEAALAAALQNRYRPALQNNTPVMIWITYKVEFELQ